MISTQSACRFDAAIVREPSPSVIHGLRDGDGGDPNFEKVCTEHTAYIGALENAGLSVTVLPPLEAFPDSIFVEDPALVFSGHAIRLRPGAPSRTGEAETLADILADHFDRVHELPPGGFVDGGDILTTCKDVMIGLSARTNEAGAKSLMEILENIGRSAKIVRTPPDILHFKSDCGLIDDETVLSTKRLAKSGVFEGFRLLETPDGEEAAANALRINDVVLLGDRFPKTAELLNAHGFKVVPLPTTEIGKIDAGLSCMSLRWMSPA